MSCVNERKKNPLLRHNTHPASILSLPTFALLRVPIALLKYVRFYMFMSNINEYIYEGISWRRGGETTCFKSLRETNRILGYFRGRGGQSW